MATRIRSSHSKPTFVVDTTGFKRFQENSLMVYTVLIFLIVVVLYFGTKDWKGITSPEEVDLGNMGVPHQRRRKHQHTSRKRYYDDYE